MDVKERLTDKNWQSFVVELDNMEGEEDDFEDSQGLKFWEAFKDKLDKIETLNYFFQNGKIESSKPLLSKTCIGLNLQVYGVGKLFGVEIVIKKQVLSDLLDDDSASDMIFKLYGFDQKMYDTELQDVLMPF